MGFTKKGFAIDDRVMNLYGSLCAYCKHNPERNFVCSAFPNGIPDEYYTGQKHHTTVRKGQANNITFLPADKMSEGFVKRNILK